MKGICAVFDEKLGYDPTNPESIENYAIQLTDKTFMDVILEKNNVMSDAVEAYANKLRKGGLGIFSKRFTLDIKPIQTKKQISQKQELNLK